MLDLVLTYSIQLRPDPRAALAKNMFASSVPMFDEEQPFTESATVAWLEIHNTQVRGKVPPIRLK